MDSSQHTVTIPISDYNEILKSIELKGVQEISETMLKDFIEFVERRDGRPFNIKKFKLYIKLL